MKYKNFEQVPAIVFAKVQTDLLTKLTNGTILFEDLVKFVDHPNTSLEASTNKNNTVGDMLLGRSRFPRPLFFTKKFSSLVYEPYKNIEIDFSFKPYKLKEYTLVEDMNDTNIQENTQIFPMTPYQFWTIFHSFFIVPNRKKDTTKLTDMKDKTYIMYVQLENNVVRVVKARFRTIGFEDPGFEFDTKVCNKVLHNKDTIVLYL